MQIRAVGFEEVLCASPLQRRERGGGGGPGRCQRWLKRGFNGEGAGLEGSGHPAVQERVRRMSHKMMSS